MTVLPRDSLIFSISFIFLKLQTGYVLQSFQLQNWKVGSKIKEDQEAKEEQEILRFFSFNSRGSTNHLVVQRFEGAFTDIQKSWAPCSHGCHRCPNFFTCGMKHGPSYGQENTRSLKMPQSYYCPKSCHFRRPPEGSQHRRTLIEKLEKFEYSL